MFEFAINQPPPTKGQISEAVGKLKSQKHHLNKLQLIIPIILISGVSTFILWLFFSGWISKNEVWFSGFIVVFAGVFIAVRPFKHDLDFPDIVVFAAGFAFISASFFVINEANSVDDATIICIAAIVVLASCYFAVVYDEKLKLNQLIKSLDFITESDCPHLVELSKKSPEIKSYLKAVAALYPPRKPVKAEYDMFIDFYYFYNWKKTCESEKVEAAKACEMVCTGNL